MNEIIKRTFLRGHFVIALRLNKLVRYLIPGASTAKRPQPKNGGLVTAKANVHTHIMYTAGFWADLGLRLRLLTIRNRSTASTVRMHFVPIPENKSNQAQRNSNLGNFHKWRNAFFGKNWQVNFDEIKYLTLFDLWKNTEYFVNWLTNKTAHESFHLTAQVAKNPFSVNGRHDARYNSSQSHWQICTS